MRFLMCLLFYSVALSVYAAHQANGPIQTRAQNPLFLLFLIDHPERAVATLKKSDWQISLEASFTNGMLRPVPKQGFGMDVDLEMWRYLLRFDFGVTDHNSVSVELPFFTMTGGFLDSFVQGFHNFLGVLNGNRGSVADGQLTYRVTEDQKSIYSPTPTGFGVGDLVLSDRQQINDEDGWLPATALKASLKFPTGNPDTATGSGGFAGSTTASFEKTWGWFHSYSMFTIAMNSGLSSLDHYLNRLQVGFGQSFEFTLADPCSLVVQVTGTSPMFKHTTYSTLGNGLFDLSVGFTGNIRINTRMLKNISYEFAFVEDPFGKGPAMDFSVFFKLGVIL